MNHSITVGGVLIALGVIGAVIAIGFGLLYAFAKGMSDSP